MFITRPKTDRDWERYHYLRWKILREAWNQPHGTEKDSDESRYIHRMVCRRKRIPIATCSGNILLKGKAEIRWMTVDTEYQGQGIGSLILRCVERELQKRGVRHFIVSSREGAVSFYKKNGYHVTKKTYVLFDEIQHYQMEKRVFC